MAGWQDRILLGPRRGAGAVAVREVEPRDLCGDGPRGYLCPIPIWTICFATTPFATHSP